MKLLSGCADGNHKQISILHFNDIYELESNDGMGGAARFSTLVEMLEKVCKKILSETLLSESEH